MPNRFAGYWVTHSTASKSVSTSDAAYSVRPSPDLANRVHSLVSRLLFGVSSPFLLATRLRAAVLPRVPSLFAASPKVSTWRGSSPTPTTFRPQVFSTSRRFAPPTALRAYCIPQPRPGFLRPGASPELQPSWLVARRCPHAVVPRALTGRNRLPRPNDPTSRPCSATRCVPRGWCLAFPSAAPLLGFLLLQAPAHPPWSRFPGPSAHDVLRRSLAPHPRVRNLAAAARLQRIGGRLAGAPVSGFTEPVQGFGPSGRTR